MPDQKKDKFTISCDSHVLSHMEFEDLSSALTVANSHIQTHKKCDVAIYGITLVSVVHGEESNG